MLDVTCFCTRTRRAARALTESYDAALAPSGLTAPQFALMRAIGRLGRPTIGALAEATGLDRSTLGRNLRVLERSGLVAIDPGRDERTRVVGITGAGRAAVAAALPLWADLQDRVAEALGPVDHAVLIGALGKLERLGTEIARP